MAAESAINMQRGYIIPIGGRESKLANPKVLEKFVQLSGGRDANIVVIPTASELPDTGQNYVNLFKNLGVKESHTLQIEKRADASREDYLDKIKKSTGIFMTGGNQLLLSTTLGGTPVAQLIRRKNQAGAHVAGTSAGAAFIPEHMIAGGQPGLMPRGSMVVLAPGLGLTNKILVDQHFSQRDRLGRLLTALSYNPFITGIGIDEDTGAFVGPDSVIEVVGSGMLTIVDMSHLDYSSVHKAGPNEPISLAGIRMHTLVEGARYDAINHIAYPLKESV